MANEKYTHKIISAFIHVILTFLYFDFLENAHLVIAKTIIGFTILFLINTLFTTFLANREWKQILISLISFICYLIFYLLLSNTIGRSEIKIEGNPVLGMFLLSIGMPVSIIAILSGSIMGIILSINYSNQIAKIKEYLLK